MPRDPALAPSLRAEHRTGAERWSHLDLILMSTPSLTAFTLPVRDLVHRAGEMRERALDVAAPEAMGDGLVSVKEGADVHLDVRLEALHDGILVSGDVSTDATGVCGRCLTDITLPVEVEFQELFAYTADDAYDYSVHDDHVDLEPVVRDAVVLSLPFQPVCQPDCPGLDPVTGERLADVPDRKPQEVLDPRWAALQGLLAQDPEAEATGDGAEREKR